VATVPAGETGGPQYAAELRILLYFAAELRILLVYLSERLGRLGQNGGHIFLLGAAVPLAPLSAVELPLVSTGHYDSVIFLPCQTKDRKKMQLLPEICIDLMFAE